MTRPTMTDYRYSYNRSCELNIDVWYSQDDEHLFIHTERGTAVFDIWTEKLIAVLPADN